VKCTSHGQDPTLENAKRPIVERRIVLWGIRRGEIPPGTKVAPGSAQNNYANARISRCGLENRAQFLEHPEVHGVSPLGSIQGDAKYATLLCDREVLH